MAKKKRRRGQNLPAGTARRRRDLEPSDISVLSEKNLLPHLLPDNFLGKII
jgi:hypothetical protein